MNLVDSNSWSWWWELSREPFLALEEELQAGARSSGSPGYFLGLGQRRAQVEQWKAPSPARLREVLLPALQAALERSDDNDITTACLVALGRVCDDLDESTRQSVAEVLEPYLAHSSQEVSETAALALGILSDASRAALLASLMLDSEEGRARVRGHEVPARTRAFAAYGLGLIGRESSNEDVRRYVVTRLAQQLRERSASAIDVDVAAVLALGRVPLAASKRVWDGKQSRLPSASREAQVHHLLGLLADKKLERRLRSHVVTSLAMLLAPWNVDQDSAAAPRDFAPGLVADTVKAMQRELRGKADRELEQSIAIALGVLGDDDEEDLDRSIRKTLQELADDARDRGARNFAWIALGRVCGRRGSATVSKEIDWVRKNMLRRLARRGSETSRWAALSLAILERGRAQNGSLPSRDVADALARSLEEAGNPADVGALAIASGILRDLRAEPALLQRLESSSDDRTRGYAALALGMLGSAAALDPLQEVFDSSGYRPALQRDCALALALLHAGDLRRLLMDRLQETRSLSVQASAAQALGRVGDDQALEPLIELLSSGEAKSARAFAAVALGLIGDGDALPWGTAYALDTNYLAATPTLFENGGFGLLNIL